MQRWNCGEKKTIMGYKTEIMILKTVIMRLKNVDFMGYIFTFYPIIMIYYGYFFCQASPDLWLK